MYLVAACMLVIKFLKEGLMVLEPKMMSATCVQRPSPPHNALNKLYTIMYLSFAMSSQQVLLLDKSKYQTPGVILSNAALMMEGVRHFLYFCREYNKKTGGGRESTGLSTKKYEPAWTGSSASASSCTIPACPILCT